jgi:hypothetical protein
MDISPPAVLTPLHRGSLPYKLARLRGESEGRPQRHVSGGGLLIAISTGDWARGTGIAVQRGRVSERMLIVPV